VSPPSDWPDETVYSWPLLMIMVASFLRLSRRSGRYRELCRNVSGNARLDSWHSNLIARGSSLQNSTDRNEPISLAEFWRFPPSSGQRRNEFD
jgi:hypothetical protein